MALVYLEIGFFHKNRLKWLTETKSVVCDFFSGSVAAGLALLCWYIYKDGQRLYYFDMKPVYYRDLLPAILIPCAFGIVLIRLSYWLSKVKLMKGINVFLGLCGQATVPIMFMHVPLNHWKDSIGYGRAVYLLIGVGVPMVVTIICNSIPMARKLLGTPEISNYYKKLQKKRETGGTL